jgi:site-specific DNA recombinase
MTRSLQEKTLQPPDNPFGRQKQNGWHSLAHRYDDGGFSGASLDRPALHELLADIQARKVDCVVVYKK